MYQRTEYRARTTKKNVAYQCTVSVPLQKKRTIPEYYTSYVKLRRSVQYRTAILAGNFTAKLSRNQSRQSVRAVL